MKPKHRGQMSESFLTAVFLSLSGGLQDAYTYLFRGKVFATIVPRNVRLGEAPSHALPINRYDPRSTGAEAYRALAREVMARNGDKPAR
mgnify:FL=1